MNFRLAAFLFPCFVSSLSSSAAETHTEEIFHRYQGRVVQIRVLEKSSKSKAAIGSGFFVRGDGLLVTNYHVISFLVHQTEDYTADAVFSDGSAHPLSLLSFDAVNDAALVKVEEEDTPFFKMADRLPGKGLRLYSLGDPRDLGFTIVEGTFNGVIEKSMYEKLHFTGSLNPGMSGGPAIDRHGRVVGINVATAGDQLSFLVPARFVRRLLDKAPSAPPAGETLLAELKRQLLENQNDYISRLIDKKFETVELGDFRLPGPIAPTFKCWGDAASKPGGPYKILSYYGSTEDEIFISKDMTGGGVEFQHDFISSDKLNPFQFASLVQSRFEDDADLGGEEEDFTNFDCLSDFIRHEGMELKAAFCLRGYKNLPGLYDAAFRAVSLVSPRRAVVTRLWLTAISAENARRFTRRYVEGLSRR